jgi:hypothetical protein
MNTSRFAQHKEFVMTHSAGIAVSVPDGLSQSRSANIDINAVHQFWFGGRLWLAALSKGLQGIFLMVSGVFLLTQIPATPKLATQLAITGGLMTAGGAAMFYWLVTNLMSRLVIDSRGMRLRMGWTSARVPWSHIERWDVNLEKQKVPQVPGLTVWVKNRNSPLVVADGHLNDQNRGDIYQLLHAFAYGKQAA